MSKERDLLGRWHNGDLLPEEYMKLMKDTKELLAQPAPITFKDDADKIAHLENSVELLSSLLDASKRKPLSDEEVIAKYRAIAVDNALYVPTYYAGFRDAEKAHGIGGGK